MKLDVNNETGYPVFIRLYKFLASDLWQLLIDMSLMLI